MDKAHKLTGKLRVFSLNTDNPSVGEKYFTAETTFGVFRKYATTYLYDPLSNEGEQRVAKDRHFNNIKNAIAGTGIEGVISYTPQCFNVSVTDLSIINVDEKGNVTLPLYEDNKLAILDGGTRFAVLEQLRSDEKYRQIVDNLPIPLIVYIEPEKRKQAFLNLNNGTKVNLSHLQVMKIVDKKMDSKKQEQFDRAKIIVDLLMNNEDSPLHDLITYGVEGEEGKILFSQVCIDHKSSLIASVFGTAKLLDVVGKDNDYFVQLLIALHDLFTERTDYIEKKKLLSLPPDGPKGNVGNWISLVNTTLYYLYLQKQIGQSEDLQDNVDHIIDCAKVYNDYVNGDMSRHRRTLLSQVYGQKLFLPMEDVDCDFGLHFGLPIPLLVNTSCSSFGVEMLPSIKKSRKRKQASVDASEIDSED